MRRRGDYQLAFWTAAPRTNPGACTEQIPVRVASVLEIVQALAATVLPLEGVANAVGFCPEGPAMVFQKQAPQVNATCAPYQAIVQPSLVGIGQIEYQRNLFEMSQGGA